MVPTSVSRSNCVWWLNDHARMVHVCPMMSYNFPLILLMVKKSCTWDVQNPKKMLGQNTSKLAAACWISAPSTVWPLDPRFLSNPYSCVSWKYQGTHKDAVTTADLEQFRCILATVRPPTPHREWLKASKHEDDGRMELLNALVDNCGF